MSMAELFGDYFVELVIIAVCSFMIVLGGVSIEEAVREKRR